MSRGSMHTMHQTLPDPIPFTQEGYQKLQTELDRLLIEREAVTQRLQVAREMGDLSENGAYHYAKFELGSIGRQVRQLQYLIRFGVVVPVPRTPTHVEFGCRVTLSTQGKQVTYQLVSIYESDPTAHKLSNESPLGMALLGKQVGDTAVITTPKGETIYTITAIN